MQYHGPTNQFTVTPNDLQRAYYSLRWAIKNIREASKLDPKGYQRTGPITGPMEAPYFAEKGILDAARELGINLGANRPGELDVSDAG
jgi:hypothetical protein